jgi:uncharacterized membrane protein
MDFESLHLKLEDLAALAFFIAAWVLFAFAAAGRFSKRTTLNWAMNRQREEWMRTMARRELRMIDTGIMAGLQQGTAFFASTSILAIGGCLALLGASDQVMTVLGDLPFATVTSRAEFEFKVLGLVVILAYSFFKFGWAYRLFNYCSILIGAVPVIKDDGHDGHDIAKAVTRAARMNVLAGGHFNAGLRGIFFSIGYLGWFIGPAVLVVTTMFVFAVLLRRQFFSRARAALTD